MIYFLFAFLFSIFLTAIVKKIMLRLKIVDCSENNKRKIHRGKIPLGGGLAIFAGFFITVFIAFYWGEFGNDIIAKHLLGLFVGGLVLMAGGLLDDKFDLRPRFQILCAIIASVVVILFGIGPQVITNPFGGSLPLNTWVISVGTWGNLFFWADLLVFIWLMGMMITTKILDGLDGLVTGIVTIGAIMIYFLSRQAQWYQPEAGLLSLIFAGACLGFLIWNWHPAKIFLGQGGSLFAGFMLGSLAIIAGSKIAIALLVVSVPMLDAVRVFSWRLINKKPIFVGDREHLHFRLLNSGLSQTQTVLLFYALSFLFGFSALFFQSQQELVALMILLVVMLLVGILFVKKR